MTHILITGGARGIGAAVARAAGALGWRVTFSYAGNAAAAEKTAEAVRAAGGAALAVKSDAADEAETVALFDQAEAAHGPVERLLVNAGVIGPAAMLADYDAARMKRIFDINVYGAFLTAREGARRMQAGGSIVIVSSAAARMGGANNFIDYAASKGATDTMTIGMAQELGPKGVRVNAVRPGLIDTDIHADAGIPDRVHQLSGGVPLARPGSADEVADGIMYLFSDQASYVTGAILDIAGGR